MKRRPGHASVEDAIKLELEAEVRRGESLELLLEAQDKRMRDLRDWLVRESNAWKSPSIVRAYKLAVDRLDQLARMTAEEVLK